MKYTLPFIFVMLFFVMFAWTTRRDYPVIEKKKEVVVRITTDKENAHFILGKRLERVKPFNDTIMVVVEYDSWDLSLLRVRLFLHSIQNECHMNEVMIDDEIPGILHMNEGCLEEFVTNSIFD